MREPPPDKELSLPDEKVLDVPAIDMTDASLAKRKPAKRAAKKTTRRRDGSIGRATFEGVNKLTADGSMTKQAAFAVYGKQTKTQPGTVSANYYRVARAAGTVKPRKRRAAATSAESRSVSSAPSRRGGVPGVGWIGSGCAAVLAGFEHRGLGDGAEAGAGRDG